MKYILDSEKIKDLQSQLVDIVINDMEDLNIDYLEKENWIAILIEDDPYYVAFEEESFYDDSFFEEKKYITSFVEALQKAGYKSCYVLSNISMDELDCCFEVEITKENISNFEYECSPFLYVIFPKDISFIILRTWDYSIIAGKKEFVEGLIGCDIETAMDIFKEYINNDDWYDFLKPMYEKYKAHNEKVLKQL